MPKKPAKPEKKPPVRNANQTIPFCRLNAAITAKTTASIPTVIPTHFSILFPLPVLPLDFFSASSSSASISSGYTCRIFLGLLSTTFSFSFFFLVPLVSNPFISNGILLYYSKAISHLNKVNFKNIRARKLARIFFCSYCKNIN